MSVGSEIHGAFQSLLKSISVVPIVTHAVALGINQEEIESFPKTFTPIHLLAIHTLLLIVSVAILLISLLLSNSLLGSFR